ncbi:aspartate carbamoyltransferase regulatory subunit [Methanolacinia petrolearia]|uniref:aspartate carbamoyltransferase regulatory subunit n=1 Tax=Methanolacinia petrolearia TaxID=54120 RepID=UPI003BACBCD3
MSEKKLEEGLLISPIRDGTVIDHITGGEALVVLRILGITGTTKETISVGTNVGSRISGKKDIVKISNRELSKEEVDRIALIAPNATINIIRDFRVFEKMKVEVPESVTGFVCCPNPGCITNSNEPVESSFKTKKGGRLQCIYCDTIISDNIVDYII